MKSVPTLTAATILVAMATSLRAGPEPPAVETVLLGLTVDLRDGSRLLVRPSGFEALPLKTSIGKLNVPLAQVASCRVDVATVADGNVALASGGATVSGAGWPNAKRNRLALIDGKTTDYDDYAVSKLPSSWVVTLPRTYLLSEIRLLLYDKGDLFYRYVAETSLDGKTYQTAADRSQGKWRSWQKLIFKPRPVRYIRVRGLYDSTDPYMHVVELEAYCKPVTPDYPKWSYKSNFGRIGQLNASSAGVFFKLVGGQTAMEPRSDYYLVDKGHPSFQAMYDLLYRAAKERWEVKAYTKSRLNDNGYAEVSTLIVNIPADD